MLIHSSRPKNPPGPPMTLGNMRHLGVHRLVATCLNDARPVWSPSIGAGSAREYFSRIPAGGRQQHAFRLYWLSLGVAIFVTLVTACTILCLLDVPHWPMFH
jgi:hypothetical protein